MRKGDTASAGSLRAQLPRRKAVPATRTGHSQASPVTVSPRVPAERPAPTSRHGSDMCRLTAPPEQRLQTQLPGLSPATHRPASEQSCCWGLNPLGCATACPSQPVPGRECRVRSVRRPDRKADRKGASPGQSHARHTTVHRTTYASRTIFPDCPKQCPLAAVRDCPRPDDTS